MNSNSQALSDKVVAAKTALFVALGDKSSIYLTNMKLWFRNKFTKEEFDRECRKLLTPTILHLHNKFLIAILNKIDTFTTPSDYVAKEKHHSHAKTEGQSSKRKRKRTHSERVTFEPYDFLDFIAEDNLACIRPPTTSDVVSTRLMPTPRYCAQELFLPDAGFIMGRFLVGSWEVGLTTVDDLVAEYIVMAVQTLLKNLISKIIMKKKHYKCTGEGSFYYDIGASMKDPTLRNTVTRQKVDDGPLELDKEITSPNFMRRPHDDGVFLSACEDIYPQVNDLITLRDLQRVFSDHNILGSHSIYSVNMERITQLMH